MAHFEVGHAGVHEILNLKLETDEDCYSLGCDESPAAGAGRRARGARDWADAGAGCAGEGDGGEGDAGDSEDDYEGGSALVCKTLTESTTRAAEAPDDSSDAGRVAQALYWQTEALMQRGDYGGA